MVVSKKYTTMYLTPKRKVPVMKGSRESINVVVGHCRPKFDLMPPRTTKESYRPLSL